MSIKPEVQPQAQAQKQQQVTSPDVYDDSVEAYMARRDAWLEDQAVSG